MEYNLEASLLASIIESASETIYAKDREGRFVVVNTRAAQLIGYTPAELIGRTFAEVGPRDRALVSQADEARILATGQPVVSEYSMVINQRTIWASSHKSAWRDESGQICGIIGVVRDITAQKAAEEKIQTLLAEKELLLREVHHRIKNNMATVEAFLTIQADTEDNPEVIASLEEANGRIHTVMVLYEKLYQTTAYHSLVLEDYVSPLVDEILNALPGTGGLEVEKHFDFVSLDVSRLQSIGIFVNELITNAVKYAFGGRSGGKLSIAATVKDQTVTLQIADDGHGVSPEARNPKGFGMELIRLIAKTLHGRVLIDDSCGRTVTLEFPV